MDKKVRVALVGCGGMASLYRQVYTQMDCGQLALVMDVNPEVASAAGEELGVPFSTRFEDCLREGIDMLDISTPNFLHKDQALAGIRAGKKILLQKPVTVDLAEAREIRAAQTESGAMVGVYMELRSHPLYHEVKDMIQKGVIGTVTSTRARKAYPTGFSLHKDSWRSDIRKTGGGSFIQLGIHCLDICMWLIGSPIQSVAAYSANRLCEANMDGDDTTAVAFAYENGAFGILDTAYNSFGRRVEIYGTQGYILVEEPVAAVVSAEHSYEGQIVKYTGGSGERRFQSGFSNEALYSPHNPYEQHRLFVRAAAEGKPAPVDFAEGLYDMALIQAVYQSAKEQRYISLKREEIVS